MRKEGLTTSAQDECAVLRGVRGSPVGLHGCVGRVMGLMGIAEDGGPLLRSGESPHTRSGC